MAQSTSFVENCESLFGENYSLIEHNERMRAMVRKDGRPSPREDGMRLHFETLGFWRPDEIPSTSHVWEVQSIPANELDLPPKLPHAGKYEWVGGQDLSPPKWLWDSHRSTTVRTSEILPHAQGYIAVSYTWGRWKIGEKKES